MSKATGGVAPGIDPNKIFKNIEEIDDAEYIEKVKRGLSRSKIGIGPPTLR